MGISPGDAVLVIERRGEQQIVYNALVKGIQMHSDLKGALGEPAIIVKFIGPCTHERDDEIENDDLTIHDVVHISHRDWLEGRAGLAYEELPGPTSGMCRYCHCTERRACEGGCSWLYPEHTVCSAPACEARWVQDNLRRAAADRGIGATT